MCEAQNLAELKVEAIELNEEALEIINNCRRHFEWLKSLDKGIPKIKREYTRLCRCGATLQKINGHFKCRECRFDNDVYLYCPKCKHQRGFRLNKRKNKCLICGHSWNRTMLDAKKLYFYIRRFRTFLKDFFQKKEQGILKKVDKLQSKFNKKLEEKYQKIVIYREKRFREMMRLGEMI